jgi:TonB family protein
MFESFYARHLRLWFTGAALLTLAIAPPVCRADLRVTEADAKQAATSKAMPEYPAMARQLKVVGKVELELVIGVDGGVEEVKIASGNPILTRPCAKAVHDWRFKPFSQDGKPARAVAPLTFEFK